MNTVKSHPEGWECSHALGAVLRSRDLAESCLSLSPAEVWSISLTQYTLAKEDRLLEYICMAKVVNSLPYTAKERAYVDKKLKEKFCDAPQISPIPRALSIAELGRKGGQAKSEAKTEASRTNGKKGGRPACINSDAFD